MHLELPQKGLFGVQPPPELLVQQEAGELGRAGALKELDEDLARRALEAGDQLRRLSSRVRGKVNM